MTKSFGRFLRQNTIALLALFIALSGSAFAASLALPNNSVGTKQLKKNAVISSKIKNNQVTGADVRESSLGKVPSAANADHATSADNATLAATATSATNAANAAALNGEAPAAYLDRAAEGIVAFAALPAATATEVVPATSITIPAGHNFVQVDTQMTASGVSGGSNWITWFQEDSLCTDLSGPGFLFRPYGRLEASSDQGTLDQHLVVQATPGVHTFRLCGYSDLDAGAYNSILIVHTIPRGSTGGSTLGPIHRGPARPSGGITTP
jgi:hypothetical protein